MVTVPLHSNRALTKMPVHLPLETGEVQEQYSAEQVTVTPLSTILFSPGQELVLSNEVPLQSGTLEHSPAEPWVFCVMRRPSKGLALEAQGCKSLFVSGYGALIKKKNQCMPASFQWFPGGAI